MSKILVLILIGFMLGNCSYFYESDKSTAVEESKEGEVGGKKKGKGDTFSPFKFLKDKELENIYRSFGKLSMRTKVLEDQVFELKNRIRELELKLNIRPTGKKRKKSKRGSVRPTPNKNKKVRKEMKPKSSPEPEKEEKEYEF